MSERGEWVILEVERVLYVDRGREVVLCDRGVVGRDGGTILAKLKHTALRSAPEQESDKDRAWRWWRPALSLPSQGTQDENPADIADQLDSIPGNNFNEAYALQTASEMLRQAASYSCPNRCDDYQNIRTNNPFANCGRCGSRLRPATLPRS